MLAVARDYGDDDGALDQGFEDRIQGRPRVAVADRESSIYLEVRDLNADLRPQSSMDVEESYTSHMNSNASRNRLDLDNGLYDDRLSADVEPGCSLIEPWPFTSRHDQSDSLYGLEYRPLTRHIMKGPQSRHPVPDRRTASSQQCSECGASFEGRSWSEAYQRHMRYEHGRRHTCMAVHCWKGFRNLDALQKHQGKRHPGELEELQALSHKSGLGIDPKESCYPVENHESDAPLSGIFRLQSVSKDYRKVSRSQKQSFGQDVGLNYPAVVSCVNLKEKDPRVAATGYTSELLCLITDTLQNKYICTLSNTTLYVVLPILVTVAVFGELLISPECPWIILPVVSVVTFRLNIVMAHTVRERGSQSIILQGPGSKLELLHRLIDILEYLTLPYLVSKVLHTSRPVGGTHQFIVWSEAIVWLLMYVITSKKLISRAYKYPAAYERFYPGMHTKFLTNDEARLSRRSLNRFGKSAYGAGNHLWRRIQGYFHTVMLAVGCLEPPLALGHLRLRWTCRCGDAFWSDVTEYSTGGAGKVAERIESVAGIKVTVTSYNTTSTNQKWTFQVPRRVRDLMWRAGARANNQPKLPQHCTPTPTSSSTTLTFVGNSSEVRSPPRLLACIHKTQDRMHLLQEPIDQVNNDLSLFQYMEKQLKQHRRRIRQLLSLRSVRGVHFVRFHLRTGNLVEVREHRRYCATVAPPNSFTQRPGLSNNSAPCNCIPPEPKREPAPNAEYRCTIDEQDLRAGPPVDPKFLLHMLNSTSCINQDSKSIFNILPRRICGQLNGGDIKPAVGWGIYYEEGLNADVVINIALAILVLGSLLFGILWSVLEMDIQGAFGVSSYMVTASGIVIAWVASQAKNFG